MQDVRTVAILIRRFSVRGGNERQAVELARYLTGVDKHVHVYCHKADETAADILPAENVHVLPGIRFDPTAAMLSYAWAARRTVHRLRVSGEVDATIGFGPSVLQDVYRLGGGTHAEFLDLTRDRPEARGGPVLDRVALLLERKRLTAHGSPNLVAPSKRVRGELIRHYDVDPDRIHVVWNGTDLERFGAPINDEQRRQVRASWGIDDDRPVALFVGQDPYRKGFDTAVAATAKADVTLVFVGRAKRPSTLAPHVHWDGERRDMERAYRAADVLVAPSRYDPFGGVVLEAAATGLPSVATRRIGATERFDGTPLEGLLVDSPEDIEGVVERIQRAIDPRAQNQLAEAARAAVADASLGAWGAAMTKVLERAARAR